MKTYIIVVDISGEKRYAKLIDIQEDNVVLQFTEKINASLFNGEQVEQYVPMIREQGYLFFNNIVAYFNHNLNVYAEPFAEVNLCPCKHLL